MATKPVRIAVTGAAGRIGYALVFRIASGAMFGAEQPVELRLVDVESNRPLLDATILEILDGVFPLLASVEAFSDIRQAFDSADWIILLGGFPLMHGMKRSELLLSNGPIFLEQGQAINEASPSARILVVANPCNTNCLIARSVARDVPSGHWFAMTRLDQNRAKAMLAAKAGVGVDRVTNVTVWGNHSESIFPDFHNALIDDRPASEVITDREWVRGVFEPTIGKRGMDLLERRKSSPAGSATQAILGAVRSIVTPTPLMLRFSAAVASDGSYGVPRGLIFSFPLRTEDGVTYSIVPNLFLDEHAQERLAANVAELQYEASAVTHLLGNGPRNRAADSA